MSGLNLPADPDSSVPGEPRCVVPRDEHHRAAGTARIPAIPTGLMDEYIRQMQMRPRAKKIGYKKEFLQILNGAIGMIGRDESLTPPVVTALPPAPEAMSRRNPPSAQGKNDVAGLYECKDCGEQFDRISRYTKHRRARRCANKPNG